MNEHLLKDVIRCDLLPNAEMITSMSKEFGVPLSDQEMKCLRPSSPTSTENNSKQVEFSYNSNSSPSRTNKTALIENNSRKTWQQQPHSSRVWTPIDNYNYSYLEKRRLDDVGSENAHKKNHLLENVNAIYDLSQKNK